MAFSRVLTVVRRTVYFTENFVQCRVTHDFQVYRYQTFSKKSIFENVDDSTATKKPRPKTVPMPKITLLLPDNSISVMVLEEAQRLAKRRNLNLVKVSDLDSKTLRPIYKLISSTFLDENDERDTSKDTQQSKDTKLLYISTKIDDHDLQIKIKNILKFLNKRHKVKIVINLDEAVKDKIQSNIEEVVKNCGKIQRMPAKKNVVLLLINPLLDSKNTDSLVNNNKENIESASSQNDYNQPK